MIAPPMINGNILIYREKYLHRNHMVDMAQRFGSLHKTGQSQNQRHTKSASENSISLYCPTQATPKYIPKSKTPCSQTHN